MIDFEKWNLRHQNLVEQDVLKVQNIFDELVSEIALLSSSISLQKEVFKFRYFSVLEKRLNELLKSKSKLFEVSIDNAVTKHWNIADDKNTDFEKKVYQKYGVNKTPIYTRNGEGLAGFKSRKGRKLSQRVWKYTGQFMQEIEMYIDLAIKEGVPATKLATTLKRYVRQPEIAQQKYIQHNGAKEFVRNVKIAKSGQEVYKSSYKNALRLARTEINAAYRIADIERFNSLEFVIGYEIKRSKHPYPCDICDMMAGIYPKNFYWDGNHPNCRCYLVPIIQSKEDFIKSQLNYIDKGEYLQPNQITTINPKLTAWIKKNSVKMKEKGLPYFARNNYEFTKQDVKYKN